MGDAEPLQLLERLEVVVETWAVLGTGESVNKGQVRRMRESALGEMQLREGVSMKTCRLGLDVSNGLYLTVFLEEWETSVGPEAGRAWTEEEETRERAEAALLSFLPEPVPLVTRAHRLSSSVK